MSQFWLETIQWSCSRCFSSCRTQNHTTQVQVRRFMKSCWGNYRVHQHTKQYNLLLQLLELLLLLLLLFEYEDTLDKLLTSLVLPDSWLVETLDKLLTSLDLADKVDTWLKDLTSDGTSNDDFWADLVRLEKAGLLIICLLTWTCSVYALSVLMS